MSNIKKLRFDHKMSQEELAKRVDVTQASVSAWETGKTVPDNQTANMLASLFGVTLDFIYDKTEEKNTFHASYKKAQVNQGSGSLTIGEMPLSNEEIEIIQTVRKSDMQTKVKILNFFIELKKENESKEDEYNG